MYNFSGNKLKLKKKIEKFRLLCENPNSGRIAGVLELLNAAFTPHCLDLNIETIKFHTSHTHFAKYEKTLNRLLEYLVYYRL